MVHQAGARPGFCSMKRVGVFLLPPGKCQNIMFPATARTRTSILFSIIIPRFDFNLYKRDLISRSKNKLYITSHQVSGLCLTQLYSISLSQKVDLHCLLDLICPCVSKIFQSIFKLLDGIYTKEKHMKPKWPTLTFEGARQVRSRLSTVANYRAFLVPPPPPPVKKPS